MKVRTVTVELESALPPARIIEAVTDFSERRAEIFPAVQEKHFVVHDLGETTADATEGTRAGPMYNEERCRYDWSAPGKVVADVIGSNIYAVEPSLWTLTATPSGDGSHLVMTWVREFRKTPKGRFMDQVFTHAGQRLFGNYAREIVENIESRG